MEAFTDQDRRVRLTSIVGVGDFGSKVLESFERYSAILPPACAAALVFRQVAAGESANDVLAANRDRLANRTTLEEINQHGGVLRDEGVEFHCVRHVLLCDANDFTVAMAAIKVIQTKFPRDTTMPIVHCLDPKDFLASESCQETSVCVVSADLCTGLKTVDIPGSVAGALLLSLMPGCPDLFEQRVGSAGAIGFSGYYGLAGGILDRLSVHLAVMLIKRHEGEPRSGAAEPAIVTALTSEFAPQALGVRLFDRRLFEGTGLKPIPATPSWTPDGTFMTTLGKGFVTVQLPHTRQHEWPALLKKLSRVHDMTTASLWRNQLDKAAGKILETIEGQFKARFRAILETLPHSPTHAERALDALEAEMSRPRAAMAGSGGDFDSDLEGLQGAISARPNPYALAGKTALFVVPLLVACLKMLPALYEPLRSNIFSILLVLVLGGMGVGYVGWRLNQAHQKVIRARDKAVASMISRQEALLSENAIACTTELVQRLKLEVAACRADLELYKRNLGTSRAGLEPVLDAPIQDKESALRAVITERKEFEQLVTKLGVDEEAWLEKAVGNRLLAKLCDPGFDKVPWTKALTGWCSEAVLAFQRTRGLPFKDLWDLQSPTRRRKMSEVLTQLTVYAAPALSKIDAADEKHYFTTPELRDEVTSIYDGTKYTPAETVHVVGMQVFACLRKARVPAAWAVRQ